MAKKKEKYVPITGLISEATDYRVYNEKIKERILWFFIGLIASGAVLYVFYESLYVSLIAGIIGGFVFIPIRRKQVIKKRKQTLTLQFRSLLDALGTSIGAGKNMFDAFGGAADEMAVQFTDEADIVREVRTICNDINNNVKIEDSLLNFAARSDISDVENFADVFATCYQKGGNIKEVIKNTATIIGDKIDIKMELETMVSGQKNECNIMLVMPVLFIVVMKSMGGGLIDLSSVVGVLSVTAALIIFVLAYFICVKITDIKL